MNERLHRSYPQESRLRIIKNCGGVTLNALHFNSIPSEIEKTLRKNHNDFARKRSTASMSLTLRRIIESIHAKNLEARLMYIWGIWFRTQTKDWENTTSILSSQRNCKHCNKALQKHESNWSRHWLLEHSHWSLAKRNTSNKCAFVLPRQRTSKIRKSNLRLFNI